MKKVQGFYIPNLKNFKLGLSETIIFFLFFKKNFLFLKKLPVFHFFFFLFYLLSNFDLFGVFFQNSIIFSYPAYLMVLRFERFA